jgi:hypothetical protein
VAAPQDGKPDASIRATRFQYWVTMLCRVLGGIAFVTSAFIASAYLPFLVVRFFVRIAGEGFLAFSLYLGLQVFAFAILLFVFFKFTWRRRWLLTIGIIAAASSALAFLPIHHNCGSCG